MNSLFSIIYIPVFIFVTLIAIFLCYFLYITTLNPSIANIAPKLWGRAVIRSALIKLNITKENFDTQQPYIIMANHQSAFDIFLLYGYIPLDFTFLSKIEVFKIPLFGLSMKLVGAIGVDRENRSGLKKTIKDMEKYMSTNRSLLIFPEGTRSIDGKILPFKKGGFLLSKKCNAKILPVTIVGTKDVLAKGSLMVKPFKNVKLIISKPIDTKDKNLNELMNEVKEVFERNLELYG